MRVQQRRFLNDGSQATRRYGAAEIVLPYFLYITLVSIRNDKQCGASRKYPYSMLRGNPFTGVYFFSFFFALKHRLWVLVRTASVRRF